MKTRLLELEVAIANTREIVDMLEQGIKKGLGDIREEIQDLRERILS